MKKTLLFVVMLLALALVFAARIQAGEEGGGETAKPDCYVYVNGIVGTVETQAADAEDKEAWAAATLNQCLNVGDKVRTSEDGKAAVIYGDAIQTRINATSTVTIAQSEESEQPDSMGLDVGEMFTDMNRELAGENAQFKINTPSGVVAVRGTQFNVKVDTEGKSIINVLDGVVAVFNELGEVLAEAGKATEMLKGIIPANPFDFNIEDFQKQLDSWKDAISIGKALEAVKEKVEEKKQELEEKLDVKKKFGF